MRNLTSKETIWHFTCSDCDNWWSYATVESWRPKKDMWCPHCGEPHSTQSTVAPPNGPDIAAVERLLTPERERHIKELASLVYGEDR